MRIVTAIGNENLNNKLKDMKEYKILKEDFNEESSLVEFLESEKNIDILFLSSNIIHEDTVSSFFKLIRKINGKIKIFYFELDENNNLDLLNNDFLRVYKTSEIDFEMLKNDIEKFNAFDEFNRENSKIIAITGNSNIGKSTFSTFFAKSVDKLDKKILLLDFDLEENEVRTLLKIKKYPKQTNNLEDMKVKINKNMDVICNLNLYFKDIENIDFLQIKEVLDYVKRDYDYIIVDTSSNIQRQYIKFIFYNSDEIIFLVEPNILGIKKSMKLLEVYNNDWKISNEKIKIVLNKANMYQLNNSVIKEIFPENDLIGKITYNDLYNLNMIRDVQKSKISKEYEKLYNKI